MKCAWACEVVGGVGGRGGAVGGGEHQGRGAENLTHGCHTYLSQNEVELPGVVNLDELELEGGGGGGGGRADAGGTRAGTATGIIDFAARCQHLLQGGELSSAACHKQRALDVANPLAAEANQPGG